MKLVIFQIMRTFRWLVVPTLRFISGLFALMLVLTIFTNEFDVGLGGMFIYLLVSVTFGTASWFYDVWMGNLEPLNKKG